MPAENNNEYLQQLIRHKLCQILITHKWGVLTANLGGTIFLLLILHLGPGSSVAELAIVATISAAILLYRMLTWPKSLGPEILLQTASNPYRHLHIGIALSGMFWGSIGVLYFNPADPTTSLVITVMMLAVVGSGSATLSPALPAFTMFSALVLIPLSIRTFIVPEPIYRVVSAGIIFTLFLFLLGAKAARDNISRIIILDHEKDELLDQLNHANERLQHYSYIDALTDIPNRRHFDEQAASMWEKGDDSYFPLSLIILDIDFFKEYNDTHGHLEGDAVLKHVAEVLVSFADAGTGDVARIGGEEFSVLLPGVDAHKAFITADEIRRAVEKLEIQHGNSSVASVLTISAGVSTLASSSEGKTKDLYAKADAALYEAKSSGRNRVMAA